MKIKVWCKSGANIHSTREAIIDLEKDWGISDEEWNEMLDGDKEEVVNEWAWERLEIGWSEL